MVPTPVRWRPLIAIASIYVLAIVALWVAPIAVRQNRVIGTLVLTFLGLTAALVWVAFLSGLPLRLRRGATAVAFALGALAMLLFRVEGVTGDFLPIVRFRFSSADTLQPVDVRPGVALEVVATANDWPQFLGPRRDGTLPAPVLARDWQLQPPRPLWRHSVGAGWGSFATVGSVAITLEQRGDDEAVVAYRLRTGEPLWMHAYPARYDTAVGGPGPRSTPAIADGRVFTMGATGVLTALDVSTGTMLWQVDVPMDTGAGQPDWGRSCSPLVHAGKVIVSAGGGDGNSLVAYDAISGMRVWAGGSDAVGYSSPLLATFAGVPQIIILNHASLAAHHPDSGAVLWETPWPRGQPNVAQPLALPGDRLLVSVGYGIGAKLYQVSAKGAELVWESPRLKSKFAHMIWHDGYVYGLDDGVLTCIDPATGERLWKKGRVGHGQLLLVGDLLLVMQEDGEMLLIDPQPDDLVEVSRFRALDGKTWNIPTLAGNVLLVRDGGEAAAYELPAE